MTAKEFYELNKGEYFMYGDEKVRVVGYDDEDDEGDEGVIISTKKGIWEFNSSHNVDRSLLHDDEKGLYVNIEDLMPIAQRGIDLCEILKGCEGVELWSDMFGKCKLSRIDPELTHQIKVETFKSNGKRCEQCFSKQGKWHVEYPEGKCILWPSETNRDWSTFKKPVKVLDDDWVACTDGNGVYTVIKYGNISESWKYIIPYDKFRPDSTEEDLKKLSIV